MSPKFGERYYDLTLNALRIMAGFLFLTHGGAKLFAWFGADAAVDTLWPRGVAGVLEFFGGLALMLGLGTRYVAFLVAGEMAVTYFWQHMALRGGFWPWENRGELPALYCFIWLFMWASGGGRWSLDAWLAKRRRGVAAGAPAAP